MGGLNAALYVATGALAVQGAALETTSNNISNANTPGYTREIVDLSSAASTPNGNAAIGNGVVLDGITSVRDQLLTLRIQQQTSSQSASSAQGSVLSAVEPYFTGSTGTVGAGLSAFFTSLSALSATPTNAAARQTVISNAQSLATDFNTTSTGLSSVQTGLNIQVSGAVTQINSLSSQIAALNPQIAQAINKGQDGGTLLDQRNQLEQQLSAITGIAITTSAQGDTVTTGNGTALVVANQSIALSTSTGTNGLTQVLNGVGTSITGTLISGSLGGQLQARDSDIPGFLAQLDTLASSFATAINTAQTSGFNLTGTSGANLFTLPAVTHGSAASIGLAFNDGSGLALSTSSVSPGSNGNLSALTSVQNQPIVGGLSPTDSFASLVNSVGNTVSQANTQSSATQSSLAQLTDQQNSVSEVSINEESSNLIRYQQAYQAAAEVITTINALFTTTLSLMSST